MKNSPNSEKLSNVLQMVNAPSRNELDQLLEARAKLDAAEAAYDRAWAAFLTERQRRNRASGAGGK